MAITKTRPTASVIKDAAAESKAKVDAAMEAKNARAADEAAKAAAARSKVTAPTTPQSVKTSQIADAAAASKAKADALMAAKSAADADAQSKMIANTVNRPTTTTSTRTPIAPDLRSPLRPVTPTTRTPPAPIARPVTPEPMQAQAPAMGSMPAGGMNQSPAFKRGGNVRKEKESYSQPSKKNNSVRGWGIARGARKAKIV